MSLDCPLTLNWTSHESHNSDVHCDIAGTLPGQPMFSWRVIFWREQWAHAHTQQIVIGSCGLWFYTIQSKVSIFIRFSFTICMIFIHGMLNNVTIYNILTILGDIIRICFISCVTLC